MEKICDGVSIHNAVPDNSGGWCEELGAQGEDVNNTDQLGWTPLMHAVHNGHTSLARELLSHGAQVSICNHHGVTAFTLATLLEFDEDILKTLYDRLAPELRQQESNMALQVACVYNLYNVAEWLLQNTLAQVNFILPQTGVTALMIVAMVSGDCKLAKLLLKSGADPTMRNHLGQEVIDMALETGNNKLFCLLHNTSTVLNDHLTFKKVKNANSDFIDELFTTNKINLNVEGDVVFKNSPARPVFKTDNENVSIENDIHKNTLLSPSMKSVFLPSPRQRLSQSWDSNELSSLYNVAAIVTPHKFIPKTQNKAKKRKRSGVNGISSWFKKVTQRRSKSLADEDDYDDLNIPEQNKIDFLKLLTGLGLEEFFPIFKEQELDVWTFLSLTVQDLAAMGIDKASSQLRILAGIQTLRTTHI